ncbi:hypothetical protein [Peribacillus frigoritolerans]|uniref:hypothetical protein n=1 Tax=Peribacillus frigoritolerans TaxID=450367 RepID=UPI002E23C33B|nr:hypothetical protein [Peribacillus frigoritolerans]
MGQRLEVLKDTAIILGLTTGLIYFFSFSFDKGIKEYYGIEDISSVEVGISSTINTIHTVSPMIGIICILILLFKFISIIQVYIMRIYFWIVTRILFWILLTPMIFFVNVYRNSKNMVFKSYSETRYDFYNLQSFEERFQRLSNQNFYMSLVIVFTSILPYFFLGISFDQFPKYLIVSLIFTIPFMVISFLVFFKNFNLSNHFSKLWNELKTSFKFVCILVFIFMVSNLFSQYGYTSAQQKEDYMVLRLNNENLVVIDKVNNILITSPINLSKPVLFGEFKLIELKPQNDKYLTMKKIKVQNGLPLKNNERKKKIENVISKINNIQVKISKAIKNIQLKINKALKDLGS